MDQVIDTIYFKRFLFTLKIPIAFCFGAITGALESTMDEIDKHIEIERQKYENS